MMDQTQLSTRNKLKKVLINPTDTPTKTPMDVPTDAPSKDPSTSLATCPTTMDTISFEVSLLPSSGMRTMSIAAADISGDGHLDVLIYNLIGDSNGLNKLLLNDGNATFPGEVYFMYESRMSIRRFVLRPDFCSHGSTTKDNRTTRDHIGEFVLTASLPTNNTKVKFWGTNKNIFFTTISTPLSIFCLRDHFYLCH